jgi:PAS domain S-box-containing protein
MTPHDSDDFGFLKELFDKAPLPYQSLDAEGRVLRVNAAWRALMGYTAVEAVGRPFADFHSPDSRAEQARRFEEFKRTGHVEHVAFMLVRKDGSEIPVEFTGTVAADVDGACLRTHCIFQDVSDRLWAERRVRASEQRYRNLVEMAHEGIWHIDSKAVTVYANPAMAQMLGYTPEEMVGRHLFEFMDEDGRRNAEAKLGRRVQGHSEAHDFEFVAKDGRRVYTAVATRPVIDERGEYQGAIAGVIDMSERRALDQRVLHTQKLEGLEVMAGGIAHDFNNLLQTILGNAELAMVCGPLPDEVQGALGSIEKAAHQAADLCRQMLTYAGRGVFAMRRLRLDDVILDIEALLRATITRKADLRFDLSADLPPVVGDASQLRQVVVNLVTNAAEALEGGGGRIDVSTATRVLDDAAAAGLFGADGPGGGEYAVIVVQDDGCGMSDEVKRSIFDPFFSTKFAGRGLGLAAVRGVAMAHGGGVTVQSDPGQGSRFEVWLPAAAEAKPAAVRPQAPAAPAVVPAAGAILVADDDDELRGLVLRMIERLGWDAVGVPDGAAAVTALAEEPARYAMVVLDWSMPVMDGREALEAIRLAAPDLPVFMSSGHSVEMLAAEVDHLRPTGFLAKPYRLSELRRVLAALAATPSRS